MESTRVSQLCNVGVFMRIFRLEIECNCPKKQ